MRISERLCNSLIHVARLSAKKRRYMKQLFRATASQVVSYKNYRLLWPNTFKTLFL